MYSRLRWFALSLFVTLMLVPPASAAPERAPALQPAPVVAADTPVTQLQPVQLTRVPSYAMSSSTLLAAGAEPIGFQVSPNRQDGGRNRHVQWALAGAAIGLVIGLLDDDPIENAVLGGVIGFGLSYVIRR